MKPNLHAGGCGVALRHRLAGTQAGGTTRPGEGGEGKRKRQGCHATSRAPLISSCLQRDARRVGMGLTLARLERASQQAVMGEASEQLRLPGLDRRRGLHGGAATSRAHVADAVRCGRRCTMDLHQEHVSCNATCLASWGRGIAGRILDAQRSAAAVTKTSSLRY